MTQAQKIIDTFHVNDEFEKFPDENELENKDDEEKEPMEDAEKEREIIED